MFDTASYMNKEPIMVFFTVYQQRLRKLQRCVSKRESQSKIFEFPLK